MPEPTRDTPGRYVALRSFLRDMDELIAVEGRGAATVMAVKDRLSSLIHDKPELPDQVKDLSGDHYARHLLYRDPGSRYEVIVMAWGPGQQTPIHDHSGIWCVEGVVEGTIDVTRYDVSDLQDDATARVERLEVIHAGLGECGALIPPVEFHRIANPTPRPAYTIHVYGGRMARCKIFTERPDGRYAFCTRELGYTTPQPAL